MESDNGWAFVEIISAKTSGHQEPVGNINYFWRENHTGTTPGSMILNSDRGALVKWDEFPHSPLGINLKGNWIGGGDPEVGLMGEKWVINHLSQGTWNLSDWVGQVSRD